MGQRKKRSYLRRKLGEFLYRRCMLCPQCGLMMHTFSCICGYKDLMLFVDGNNYFKCYNSDSRHPAFGKDFREVEPYSEELTDEIELNAQQLIVLVNSLFTELSELTGETFDIKLSSGWRPVSYSREIRTSTKSHHCFGRAMDIQDPGNRFYKLIEQHLELLVKRDMAMEHMSATSNWLHLQSKLPKSGRNIFYP